MDQVPLFSFKDIYAGFFGADVVIAPEYLLISLLIAFILYKTRGLKSGFWAWVAPKKLYRHASTGLDIKLFIIGRLMGLLGLFNKVVMTTVIAGAVAGVFSAEMNYNAVANPILIAAIVLLLNDVVSYWLHRTYHQISLFWPIHSVHHSAEVLTPITAYRQHPVAIFVSTFFHSIFFGALQGIFLGLFVTEFNSLQLVGLNVFYFAFLILIRNFHHSHIWVSFGTFWGYIFVSPAQHQIHHSLNPIHHNKNYGEVLAVWDWIFGTIYVPKTYEDISVGIADQNGQKLPQKHNGALQALFVPFYDMWSQATSKRWHKPEE